jgi:endonuclease/exonuclease/phosphatase family metal-dependent hydrolase
VERPVGFWGKFLRVLLGVLAIGYPLALVAVILAFRLIGEQSWLVTAVLYLPRIGFAIPLPFLTLWILFRGPRRLLLTQVVALALLLFPLMGLHLSSAGTATPGAFHLRVLSYNIDAGFYGPDAILAQLHAADADVILLQEARPQQSGPLKPGLTGYFFDEHDQFMIASRYPIQQVFEPSPLMHDGKHRSPRFMGYELTTPAGPIRVYNIHPISPRDALEDLRGPGFRTQLFNGHLLGSGAPAQVAANADLRQLQLRTIAGLAAQSSSPVLIAGDTNLPALSWALNHWLGDFQDGFTVRGTGFGYTFPAPAKSWKKPWMRIDRIMADSHFRFLSFKVLKNRASDHYAVTADLELPPR